MTAPSATEVGTYLDNAIGASWWTPDDVASALAAEKAAQAKRCRVPADAEAWPDDLAEALKRRTAHNLAVRPLPLGVQPTVTEAAALATFVGGTDAEVRRLEAPHRKLVIG